MKSDTSMFMTPSGVIVLIQWADGKLSSRSVPWADLKSAGDSALVEACEMVSNGLTQSGGSEISGFRIVAAANGHGHIFHEVSSKESFALGTYQVTVS